MVTCWRAFVPRGHVHIAYTIRSGRKPKGFVPAAIADTAVAARQVSLALQRAINTWLATVAYYCCHRAT